MLNKLLASLTLRRKCRCGALARLAADRDAPIHVKEDTGEFELHAAAEGLSHAHIPLYYCPFCGGRLEGLRGFSRAKQIPRAERNRLVKLTMGLNTLDEVQRSLGGADHVSRAGTFSSPGRRKEVGESIELLRVLRYSRLSQVATVIVCERANGSVGISFEAKPETLP